MAQVKLFETYDDANESFDSYLERLNAYYMAMNIGQCDDDAAAPVRAAADKQKVVHFISCMGRNTYSTLRDLCSPAKPIDKTFDEIKNLLESHFKPKKLEIAETYRFHQCRQQAEENVSTYSARLRHMASTCNFGENLNRALRDQFVAGIKSAETRKKLLGKDNTFDEVVKLALADEAAMKETAQLPAAAVNSVRHSFHSRKSSVSVQKPVHKVKSEPKYAAHRNPNVPKPLPEDYACYSCGRKNHKRSECRFRDATCHKCSRKGHIASVCQSHVSRGTVHTVEKPDTADDVQVDPPVNDQLFTIDEVQSVPLYYSSGIGSIKVQLLIEGNEVAFQLDTGCGMSIVPKQFYNTYLKHLPLQPTSVVLETYTKEVLKPLGEVTVEVVYERSVYKLPLLVTESGNCPLFGRNWLCDIKLNWPLLLANVYSLSDEVQSTVNSTACSTNLNKVLSKYDKLFDTSTVGCYTGEPIELTVQRAPTFHKARPVPYALQEKVESTLKEMEENGIIERVSTASCAAPIVVVGKKDSDKVRICGDFSVTYNACADLVRYPLPRIEDLHTAMRGCTVFSCIDIRDAYHNCRVSEESQKYLTINTHIGLFTFKRLPNGVHSGPAIFQRIMDTVLAGLPKVICRLDDILCGGSDDDDHLKTLSLVLDRLQNAGFKLNKSKCKFLQSSVTYLGHVIDAEGLHPTADKLKAIREAPAPKDVTALKAYLGLLMFYSRFLPNHATILAPLNNLMKAETKWKWTQKEQEAFEASKKLLCESHTLVHYDPDKELFMSCDASQYGAGVVLSHKVEGQYRPVAFASCTLSTTQRNYSQIEKEGFSIIFGLKRFHQFLAGRSFTIITDHRPLLSIFAPDKAAPLHTAARLQRWSLILSSYKYELQFRKTTEHVDADCLSRLPLSDTWNMQSENVDCFFLDEDVLTTVTCDQIKKATRVDPVLSKVHAYVLNGWPSSVQNPQLYPYKERKLELSVEQGCVLWGMRVIVPDCLRSDVLKELHETHPGMCRMKAIARSFVWWPNIDADIEKTVADCSVCQAMQSAPSKATVHPWSYPSKPWSRVHVDYAGPVNGAMYLVVVCAYSKYPEIIKMKSTTSAATIAVLRELFSRHGLCEVLVSDNGPQFVSLEFETFCMNNGILHKTSAVYKPATNGQAERVVRILKTAVKQAELTHRDVDSVIANYFLVYRSTPHSTTGEIPSVLLMGRRLRTRHDLMIPSVDAYVQKKQLTMQKSTRIDRQFEVNDAVLVRNFAGLNKWQQGVIAEKLGNRYYLVHVNGTIWKRHVDQIVRASSKSEPLTVPEPSCSPEIQDVPENNVTSDSATFDDMDSQAPQMADVPTDVTVVPPDDSYSSPRRYPERARKSPSYLSDYVRC